MIFCSKCGNELADDAKFCAGCGTEVTDQQGQGQQQTQNQQQSQDRQYNQDAQNKTGNGEPFFNQFMNTKDHTSEFTTEDINDAKGVSILAYLWILFFVPLVAKPNSKYAKFHANQGLILLITSVALSVIYAIVSAILYAIFGVTFLGETIGINWLGRIFLWLFRIACYVPVAVLFIVGIMNAVNAKAKELPIVGKFTLIR